MVKRSIQSLRLLKKDVGSFAQLTWSASSASRHVETGVIRIDPAAAHECQVSPPVEAEPPRSLIPTSHGFCLAMAPLKPRGLCSLRSLSESSRFEGPIIEIGTLFAC